MVIVQLHPNYFLFFLSPDLLLCFPLLPYSLSTRGKKRLRLGILVEDSLLQLVFD